MTLAHFIVQDTFDWEYTNSLTDMTGSMNMTMPIDMIGISPSFNHLNAYGVEVCLEDEYLRCVLTVTSVLSSMRLNLQDSVENAQSANRLFSGAVAASFGGQGNVFGALIFLLFERTGNSEIQAFNDHHTEGHNQIESNAMQKCHEDWKSGC